MTKLKLAEAVAVDAGVILFHHACRRGHEVDDDPPCRSAEDLDVLDVLLTV